MRPVIGICTALERARWGLWDTEAVLLARTYVASVQTAGGLVLLLPPDDQAGSLEQILDLLDGLVLAGGPDMDPGLYGVDAHPDTIVTSPERDRFEVEIATAALGRDLPLLGICRGMEVINVATGGTLIQHLPDQLGHGEHCHTPGTFAEHDVRLEPHSLAAEVIGVDRTSVKSHHHQGLGELGEGVVASGWSVRDGLVEAIELPGRRFALGLLWHAEEDERARVLAFFVAEARAGVASR